MESSVEDQVGLGRVRYFELTFPRTLTFFVFVSFKKGFKKGGRGFHLPRWS